MRIEEITTADELQALRPEWSALWERCAHATPFQAPEWVLPWWRRLFGGGEMWTVAVRRGGRLTGLAPMFLFGCEHEPRQIACIGAGVTDYLGFLLEEETAAEDVQSIWTHLGERSWRWDICDLQEIHPESPLLRPGFPAGWRVERSVSGVCPVVKLTATMEQFEADLAPKFRHNLRNARNRLLAIGETSFETAAPEQDSEYLEALFQLHAARWECRNESGMLSTPALQSFYQEVAFEFRRRGWLRFHGLRYRGRLAGVVCIFLARRRAFSYLGGFDDTLAAYSPGTALLAYAIEQAIGEGATEFDFLRKRESYKYRWGAVDRANARLVIRHEWSRSFAGMPQHTEGGLSRV
jgi:CelD/BcsL family acetyltransferase involved in cellulose biosynthesis